MQTVVDNTLLNYEILGHKRGITILILPGWGRNFSEWIQVGNKLSKKYRVILLDLPGFGGSSSPERVFGVYDYAEIVEKFIGKLKIKEIILLGHSFGGKISIIIAKNNFVKRLFLIAPSGAESRNITTKTKIVLFKILKNVLFFLPRHTKDQIAFLFSSRDYRNAGALRESFKKIANQNVLLEAKKIKVPTIIIWGEYDKEIPVENAKRLKKIIPKSIIRIVWDVGHSPHLEKSDKFYNLLQEYL